MTQRTTSAPTPLRQLWRQSLLVQSLSWISVLTLLANNLVLAQTSPASDPVVVPTIEESKPPAPAAPVAKSASDTSQSASAPAIRERLRSQVSDSPTPARVERLRQKLSPTPTPVRREQPKLEVATPAAPRLSVPKVRSVAQPPTKLPSRTLEKTATNPAPDYNGAYIDPTEYRIGATRSYEAPNTVVLSERSTGCKAVLRQGQGLSGSLCGASQQRTRVAIKGNRSLNNVQLANQSSSWKSNQVVAKSGISPVRRVGTLSATKSGLNATRRQGQIASVNPVNRAVNSLIRLPKQPGTNPGLLFPLTIPAQITSLFGWRIHPITGDRRFHSGTDLGAPQGVPVLAADAGKVAIANYLGGYGLTVVLDHNKFTQQTLYAHLSEIFVQPGEWVEQGTVIGRVGSTGNSTGPHLHFETRQLTPEGWVATDPSVELQSALAQLVEALRTAQSPQHPNS